MYALEDLSFWRARFLDVYDDPDKQLKSWDEFRKGYQCRRQNLRLGCFREASPARQLRCATMLKNMLMG